MTATMPTSTFRLMPVELVESKKSAPREDVELPEYVIPAAPPQQHHVMIHKEPDAPDEPKTPWQEQVNDVIDMLPVPYQKRARRLMKRLRGHIVLSDDEMLRVVWAPHPVTGQVEQGSHLMDLLQYLLMTGAARQKSTMTKPVDFESFLTLMASVGIPNALVGAERAQRMRKARRSLLQA